MWNKGWRDQVWSQLDKCWDIIVIGGGITGAGILREATQAGLRVLLLEADDFSSGTSSRSSKLVHGGFRYLKNAQIKLTYKSVRERERLLIDGKGLITPLGCLLANYQRDTVPAWAFGIGLVVYDLLANRWGHRHYGADDFHNLCSSLNEKDLLGGYRFIDAQTDDARLVLRLIIESVHEGGFALNYARVINVLQRQTGQVCGISVQDESLEGCGRTAEVEAAVVINATGVWADELRNKVAGESRLRRLRGSHIVFPSYKFPLNRSINMLHPRDNRPVFALPWDGVTLVGTTDIDHEEPLCSDPTISSDEIEYLMAFVNQAFPCLSLTMDDIQVTFSGIRPVVNTGKADPSKESREHVLWKENGLITVTGGKLTTFRLMAQEALKQASKSLLKRTIFNKQTPLLFTPPVNILQESGLSNTMRLRLIGRYGRHAGEFIDAAEKDELVQIGEIPALWAELRWAATSEGVLHLDDLLMRRVRLGLLAPHGGIPYIERIRQIAQPVLEWDDSRWYREVKEYIELWETKYSPHPLNGEIQFGKELNSLDRRRHSEYEGIAV